MKKILLSVLFLGLMFVLAACGGGNENSPEEGNTNNDQEQESSGGTEESDSSQTLDVTATNFQFNKEEYTVKAGEPVTINLSSEEGQHGLAIEGFDVNIQGNGETTFTPKEPGEYTIYCSIPCGEGHSDMKSTLVVQ